jgi:hypothetical protein
MKFPKFGPKFLKFSRKKKKSTFLWLNTARKPFEHFDEPNTKILKILKIHGKLQKLK